MQLALKLETLGLESVDCLAVLLFFAEYLRRQAAPDSRGGVSTNWRSDGKPSAMRILRKTVDAQYKSETPGIPPRAERNPHMQTV